MLGQLRAKWRLVAIYVLFISINLAYFWTQSRYPALGNKAYFGTSNPMSGIAFDVLLPINEGDGFARRVLANTVNWCYTNWKGMTFGLIFAVLALSFLRELKPPLPRGRLSGTLAGVAIGAPLGVCTNCATPVGQGLRDSGLRAETALSVTMSSPTLNVIAVSILFSSFPAYVAWMKLGMALFLILVVMPIIVKLFGPASEPGTSAGAIAARPYLASVSWNEALRSFGKGIFASSQSLLLKTFPLMFLAGFLGSLLLETFDLSSLSGKSLHFGWVMLVAALGTLLPVPMAFDVIFSSVLFEGGLSTSYVMALLSTLGIFSIYPLLVFARTISLKVALVLGVCVWLSGVASSYMVNAFELRQLGLAKGPAELSASPQLDRYAADPDAYVVNLIHESCGREDAGSRCRREVALALFEVTGRGLLCEFAEGFERIKCLAAADVREFGTDFKKCYQRPKPNDCLRRWLFSRGKHVDISSLVACAADDPYCPDLAKLLRGMQSRTMNRCKPIRTDFIKEHCRYRVALNRGVAMSVAAGLASCAELTEPNLRMRCSIQVVARSGRLEDCVSLGEGAEKCRIRVSAHAAMDAGDTGLCRRLSDESEAECLVVVKAQTALEKIRLLRDLAKLRSVDLSKGKNEENDSTGQMAQWSGREYSVVSSTDGLRLSRVRQSPAVARSKTRFEELSTGRLNLETPPAAMLSLDKLNRGHGLSSGDVNGDGWTDFVAGVHEGLILFQNKGGGGFEPLVLTAGLLMPETEGLFNPLSVALVDLNNDERPEIVVGNLDGRVLVFFNNGKSWKNPRRLELPAGGSGYVNTLTFADFNRDGRLDIFAGRGFLQNWLKHGMRGDLFINDLYLQTGDGFVQTSIEEATGNTLTALATDFDHDGIMDLLVGKDGLEPDEVQIGLGDGRFRRIRKSDGLIPVTPRATMSYDSADYNNDGRLEIYGVGLSRGTDHTVRYCDTIRDQKSRARCTLLMKLKANAQELDTASCSQAEAELYAQCVGKVLMVTAKRLSNPDICGMIPKALTSETQICRMYLTPQTPAIPPPDPLDQKHQENVLLRFEGTRFQDVAESEGIANSGWGWTARFADLDNDGWQDLFAVNGSFRHTSQNVKGLFQNLKGRGFKSVSSRWGLMDMVDTTSFLLIDFDHDGDLDLLRNGNAAPLRLAVNNGSNARSVVFHLRDHVGNRLCIGCKILIRHTGQTPAPLQMRELKAGGGYASIDAPMAHFGLGRVPYVKAVEIEWSTGERSTVNGPFAAGFEYKIERLVR